MNRKLLLSAFAVYAIAVLSQAAPASAGAKAKAVGTPPLKQPLRGWQTWLASGERILPASQPPVTATNAVLRLVSARNATAAASFALRSSSALDDVAIKAGPLVSASGARFGGAIDIRIVKLWYQDANGWFAAERAPGDAVLVPELLLHDDSLVKTDAAAMENLVRGADGQYRRIKAAPGGQTTPAAKDFIAADDAAELLPFALAANATRQFYLKVEVPEGTPHGLYKGALAVTAKGADLGHIDLALYVADHSLGDPTSRFSGRDSLDGRECASGVFSAMTTTDYERYASVVFLPKTRLTKSAVDYLRRNGIADVAVPPDMLGQVPALFGGVPSPLWIADAGALSARPKGVADKAPLVAAAKGALALGAKDARLFVPSRPAEPVLPADRAALEEIDSLGVGTWAVSDKSTYTNLADVLTSPVEYGLPLDKVGLRPPPIKGDPYGGMETTDSTLAEAWHALGTPLYLAITLPAGVENPSIWRRAAGIECFFVGYEGFILPSFVETADPWNDWSRPRLRARTFLYPTKTGFVPTLAFEGLCEGVLDVRYLSAVRRLAAKLRYPEPKDYKVDMEGRKATMWMQWIKVRQADLDNMRLEAIAWIEKLEAVRKAVGR